MILFKGHKVKQNNFRLKLAKWIGKNLSAEFVDEIIMDEKSRAFIFGKRLKDTPEIPQMTKEQMEQCADETEKYIPKTVKE